MALRIELSGRELPYSELTSRQTIQESILKPYHYHFRACTGNRTRSLKIRNLTLYPLSYTDWGDRWVTLPLLLGHSEGGYYYNTATVPLAGLEPATYRLEGECSIH